MNRSESIADLAGALAKAQGAMKGAKKDESNPFFKSKYADLASVWEACRDCLASNGLAVIQTPTLTEAGVFVETLLCHESGEWVSDTLCVPVAKHDAQGVGSAITYARRYALSAFVGVAPEDDDGNAAAASAKGNGAIAPPPPKQTTEQIRAKGLEILTAAAQKGRADLETAWNAISMAMRQACKEDLQDLKDKAKQHDKEPVPA